MNFLKINSRKSSFYKFSFRKTYRSKTIVYKVKFKIKG